MDLARRVERGWIRDGIYLMKLCMSSASRDRLSFSSLVSVPGGVERNRVIIVRLSWCWMGLARCGLGVSRFLTSAGRLVSGANAN